MRVSESQSPCSKALRRWHPQQRRARRSKKGRASDLWSVFIFSFSTENWNTAQSPLGYVACSSSLLRTRYSELSMELEHGLSNSQFTTWPYNVLYRQPKILKSWQPGILTNINITIKNSYLKNIEVFWRFLLRFSLRQTSHTSICSDSFISQDNQIPNF